MYRNNLNIGSWVTKPVDSPRVALYARMWQAVGPVETFIIEGTQKQRLGHSICGVAREIIPVNKEASALKVDGVEEQVEYERKGVSRSEKLQNSIQEKSKSGTRCICSWPRHSPSSL